MGPDNDKERPRFQTGEIVEVTDPYGRHYGHKGPVAVREWALDVWKLAPTWRYKVERCDRFFRAYQLKRVLTVDEKRAELHRLIDKLPEEILSMAKRRLEDYML